ncbi:MAG TPA: hypothetical protein VFZ36_00345 [Vicinamibacterales bacterium]
MLSARCWVLVLVLVLGAASAGPARAQGGMPDPSQMSGVPLPSPELPAGTLTVRVVRGAVTNNVAGQKVELTIGGSRREATTDASGRAEFTGLRPGDRVQASTTVDGARRESQLITVPAQGGVRVMLVVPDAGAEPPNTASEPPNPRTAEPGVVVFGGESRFIVERGDESLHVFYVLDIVNSAAAPVTTDGPLIFDLPSGATGATLLEGSTAQATVSGSRVTVTGPFAPGTTALQIAYELPYRGARVTIEQKLPAALPVLAAAGETTGGVTMASPQFSVMRDMDAGGNPFKVGNGPGIPAGGTLTLTFDNLPHHPRWPRFMALGVAVAIMIGGLVFGFGAKPVKRTVGRRALIEARDARFAELEALEEERRSGAVSETRYASERSRIVASLEDIYAALDVEQGS